MDKTKVFVVDDEPDCSRLVQTILERTGAYEVKVVNRPREALAAAREFKPSIFVLDVDMPGKDGGELSRDIEADEDLREAPVLFLTGLVRGEETRSGATLRGGKLFLSKPPTPLLLVGSIQKLLSEAAFDRRGAIRHPGGM